MTYENTNGNLQNAYSNKRWNGTFSFKISNNFKTMSYNSYILVHSIPFYFILFYQPSSAINPNHAICILQPSTIKSMRISFHGYVEVWLTGSVLTVGGFHLNRTVHLWRDAREKEKGKSEKKGREKRMKRKWKEDVGKGAKEMEKESKWGKEGVWKGKKKKKKGLGGDCANCFEDRVSAFQPISFTCANWRRAHWHTHTRVWK